MRTLKNGFVAALSTCFVVMLFPNTTLSEITPPHLRFQARSAILMDAISGQTLFEKDPSLKMAPASFVKILSLYLAFDAIRAGDLKMDDGITISRKAWKTGGSKMFLKPGERVTTEDLVKGIAIVSGNDACIALAEKISGVEGTFVAKMNEKAKTLGLADTQFQNSHGMPAKGQYTTAMDMAALARRYLGDHPEALRFHSALSFEHQGIFQRNRNVLLQRNLGVDGLMTGHVEESGYHLLATAKRNGWRLIAVIMGSQSLSLRAREAQDLLEYGFKKFSVVEAFPKGVSLGSIKVIRGKKSRVELLPAEDGRVVVAKGEEASISHRSELPDSIAAPVNKDQPIGKVLIQGGGKVLKEVALLSSSEVPKGIPMLWFFIGGGIIVLLLVILIVALRRYPYHRRRVR